MRSPLEPNNWVRLSLVTLFLWVHCEGAQMPPLVDTLGSAIDQTEVVFSPDFRQLAPIALVGLVSENRVVESRPAVRMPEVLLELHVVRVAVELLIRGKVTAPEVELYYFAQSPQTTQPNPRYKRLFEANEGGRYVFFLCRENGIFRSIGDVGEYSVPVLSGAHPQNVGEASDPGRTLAGILLTRGEGAIPEKFARSLRSSSIIADQWGSRSFSVRLLRNLLREPEPIRESACLVLATRYNGQHDCEYGLDQSVDPTHESSFTAYLQDGRDAQLLAALLSTGNLDFPIIGKPDSRKRIFEELQSIEASQNPAVSRAACAALSRYYSVGTRNCE